MRIGIVGAENSHAAAIGKLLNVEKAIPGFEVTHLWGEAPQFVEKTLASVKIPHVVARPEEMLGQVDAVMVDHRDGKHHLDAARSFVEAGMPVFVDKPLGTSLAACRAFLSLRRKTGAPVVTMSAIPHQACVAGLKADVAAAAPVRIAHFIGPGDAKSEYGGVFFYGVHQVDLMVELFGPSPRRVRAALNGSTMTAVVEYADDLNATITMAKAGSNFRVAVCGEKGEFLKPVVNDANIYVPTARIFTTMFATRKEPFDDRRMLAPVAILEAISEAIGTGGAVDVEGM